MFKYETRRTSYSINEIYERKSPQVVVAKRDNIFEVTERLFVAKMHSQFVVTRGHNILKVTEPGESGHASHKIGKYYVLLSSIINPVRHVGQTKISTASTLSRYF